MVRSYDVNAELRYLVEVHEEWQAKVISLAFDGEFDCFADLKITTTEQGEQKEVVFCKRDEGRRVCDARKVGENVHSMIRDIYD